MISPDILIADEPTSMIDACSGPRSSTCCSSCRAENRMTIVFITHDLGLAYYVSDTILIMSRREDNRKRPGPGDHRFAQEPVHPALLADVPKLNEEWKLG